MWASKSGEASKNSSPIGSLLWTSPSILILEIAIQCVSNNHQIIQGILENKEEKKMKPPTTSKFLPLFLGGTILGLIMMKQRVLAPSYVIFNSSSRRACTLRALGLLLADGTPTVGRGKTFKNRIFGPKTEILGPKKRSHFLILTMFWPRPEKVVQKKSAFAQIIKGGNVILGDFLG